MNPEIKRSRAAIFEFGLLFHELIMRDLEIEKAYLQAGPQRSAEITRSWIMELLEATIAAKRAGFRILGNYRREISGDASILELLATAPAPSPLTLLLFELREVQSLRVAPLLRYDADNLGEGPYNFLRRYIRAGAAAAVQVLLETKLKEKDAAKLVTDALEGCKFVNPRLKGEGVYSVKTVMGWRKGRKRRGSASAGFEDQYQEWLRQLRDTVAQVEQSRLSGQSCTDEKLREIILFRLVNVVRVFTYQVKGS